MVRLGQLLDPAHKMARLRPDAVRAEQVVPQDPVHLRLGPPHHSVLDFRGAHPRRLRAGRLSTLRVSVAWARQVQVASQERGLGDVAQDRQRHSGHLHEKGAGREMIVDRAGGGHFGAHEQDGQVQEWVWTDEEEEEEEEVRR